METIKIQRGIGAPGSALPGLAGFGFLVMIAPGFYAAFFLYLFGGAGMHWLNGWFSGIIAWCVVIPFGVILPARNGKIWAIRIIRYLSFLGLALYAAMFTGDFFLYFLAPAPQNGTAIFLLVALFLPLTICAWFLIRALRHEPWFDPNATGEEIGPSLGTAEDFSKAAGLNAQGHLPDSQRAAALALGAPPPRWLCYIAPPYAAARLRRWWWFALTLVLCVAALVFAIGIPLRALMVYLIMGGIADRLRVIQLVRLNAARFSPPA